MKDSLDLAVGTEYFCIIMVHCHVQHQSEGWANNNSSEYKLNHGIESVMDVFVIYLFLLLFNI